MPSLGDGRDDCRRQDYVGRLNREDGFYRAAVRLTRFIDAHAGRYAMGDRAGMVGFLSSQPVVQFEGLVADKWMVEAIRYKRGLREALEHYEIDYYVATSPREQDGCYYLEEPRLAGPMAPHMTARICDTPVLVFDEEAWRTVVFQIRREVGGR